MIAVVFILMASVIAYWNFGWMVGFAVLFGGLGVAGLFFYFEIRVLMHSGIGRRLFSVQKTQVDRVGYPDEEVRTLLGQHGHTVTRMTPTGKISLNGRIYPATSLDGYLAKGMPIVVKEANPVSIKISPA